MFNIRDIVKYKTSINPQGNWGGYSRHLKYRR